MSKILIGADIVPTKSNMKLFENGEIEVLLDNRLISKLKESDFNILNLEVPLCDEENKIDKCGPNLIASTKSIKGLKKINPYFYTLANNHILDQGVEGLKKTMETLEKNNINYCGVGRNIEEASKPYIFNLDNNKIGIYCCTEHEFSIATSEEYGANPFDPLYSFDHVKKLKEQVDIVIVLFHGGKEHYRYPSPKLQKIFRKFSEVGADYVIAQHTHCIGCEEVYNGSLLLYGQGNFLFDNSNSEYWQKSLLLEINISKKDNSYNYIPIVKDGCSVRTANGSEKDSIMKRFNDRSNEILKKDFVKNKYDNFSSNMLKEYLLVSSGRIGRLFIVKILNKLSNYKFLKKLYSKQNLLVLQNYIECEAHNELMINGIKNELEKK